MSELFDQETVKVDSPRLVKLKEADVQTHHAPWMETPWMAIPMEAAREVLKGYDDAGFTSIASVTASYGRLLEEYGIIFEGMTKREVEDDALASIERRGGE